jgi:cytochrome c oxidase subunit 4
MLTLSLVIAYWIAFGPHGPRALDPPGEGKTVFFGTIIGVLASLALFVGIRALANPAPHTMNKEWQEASNEYLKVDTHSRPNDCFLC